MRSVILIIASLAFAQTMRSAELKYSQEVARWHEINVPSEAHRTGRIVWSYAASYSRHEWRVFLERDQICAQLITATSPGHGERPAFTPKVGGFQGASAFAAVDDG